MDGCLFSGLSDLNRDSFSSMPSKQGSGALGFAAMSDGSRTGGSQTSTCRISELWIFRDCETRPRGREEEGAGTHCTRQCRRAARTLGGEFGKCRLVSLQGLKVRLKHLCLFIWKGDESHFQRLFFLTTGMDVSLITKV